MGEFEQSCLETPDLTVQLCGVESLVASLELVLGVRVYAGGLHESVVRSLRVVIALSHAGAVAGLFFELHGGQEEVVIVM